jgi:hypothetical protein
MPKPLGSGAAVSRYDRRPMHPNAERVKAALTACGCAGQVVELAASTLRRLTGGEVLDLAEEPRAAVG